MCMTTFVHHSETVLCHYGMASYYKTIDRPTGSALHSLNNVVANLLGISEKWLAWRCAGRRSWFSVRSSWNGQEIYWIRRRHSGVVIVLRACVCTNVRHMSETCRYRRDDRLYDLPAGRGRRPRAPSRPLIAPPIYRRIASPGFH